MICCEDGRSQDAEAKPAPFNSLTAANGITLKAGESLLLKAGATVQVIDRNPDKAAAAALLGDFRAVAAAGLRGCASTPLTGDAARRALSLADAAIQRLAAQVNPKITLSVLAAKLG